MTRSPDVPTPDPVRLPASRPLTAVPDLAHSPGRPQHPAANSVALWERIAQATERIAAALEASHNDSTCPNHTAPL